MDFFPNSVDRITRALAKQINFVSSVYDEDPRNLHTSVSQELGSAVRSHLIRTGRDWHIKSEDSVPTDALAPRNASVSVEEENAECGKRTRAGCSIPVEPIGTVQSLV